MISSPKQGASFLNEQATNNIEEVPNLSNLLLYTHTRHVLALPITTEQAGIAIKTPQGGGTERRVKGDQYEK